tara:strand:+ start:381 stop:1175 length:795 start_codon:yes stop_codon:yes gene_type:complete
MEGLPTEQLEMVASIEPRLIAFGFLAFFGMILWVFGRKLARSGCGISGLMAGVSFAMILPSSHESPQSLLIAVCIGGVVGFLLAWFLFRVASGLTLAVTLALAIPIADLAWRDNLPPVIPIKVETDVTPHLAQGVQTKDVIPIALEVKPFLHRNVTIQRDSIRNWRDQLDTDTRHTMGALALAGALSGLFIGLVFPYLATSAESSLFGGMLMLIGFWNLAAHFKVPIPTEKIASAPQVAIAVGLITIMGIIAQWIMWRKKSTAK